MRWKELLVGLMLTLAVSAGCQRQCFLSECDLENYRAVGLSKDLEFNPAVTVVPAQPGVPKPATVNHPEREPRHITLAECIAMALENGTAGSTQLTGTSAEVGVRFTTGTVFPAENNIRVLALEPAIVGSNIEASLSKFDARWVTSMAWQKSDTPLGGNFLQNFTNGDNATLTTALVKPLPTGGVAGITFRNNYQFLDQPPLGILNPSYRPVVQFQFDQPLLQGYGV
jgi:hypothetical protein